MAVTAVAIGSSVAGSAAATAITGVTLGTIGSATIGAALAYTAISVGVSMAISYAANEVLGLTPDAPEMPSLDSKAQGILFNDASPVAPIPVVYGSRKVGGTRVFIEASGEENEYLHLVLSLAEGQINAINTVYLNDIATTDSKFDGFVEVTKYTGSDSQTADSNLVSRVASWTSAHRLQGTAYLYIRLKYDQDVFPGGLPTITADVDGIKVYDPRTSSSVFSNNPALCIRDYLTNARYGRGIPTSMIDDTSFSAAANYCEETVSKGGTTAQRYTCDGVVDTSRTSLEIVRELLTSCRGMLVFTGGKYKLVIDKPETAAFTFDEDNIVGSWQISLGSKTNTYNRIRAEFFNPDRSWQGDIAVVESSTLRTADNNLLLEREIQLPFTSNIYTAKQIATMALNQSRQQIMTTFTATIEGTRCEVGDVVYVTHSTPGWTNKKFRVMAMSLKNDGHVTISLLEYADSVYDFGTIAVVDDAPNTNLPDPSTVAQPGLPAISEEIYVTREGAGVKAKAILTWTAAPDIFVRQYEVQYKLTSASTYTSAGTTSGTTFDVLDIAPGTYDFRVKAINSIGVSSGWKTTTQEIFGLLAKPSALTNLTLSAVSSMAVLTWDQSVDLDVRIGGKIEIRHSSLTSGATWANSVSLGSGSSLNGTATFAVLTLVEGTYLVRAVDSSGIKSDTVSISTDAATALAYTTLTTITESPTFPGVKNDTVVIDSLLRLQGQEDKRGSHCRQ